MPLLSNITNKTNVRDIFEVVIDSRECLFGGVWDDLSEVDFGGLHERQLT